MYEDLVKALRNCSDCYCGDCKYKELLEPGNWVKCTNKLIDEAANAIEELKKSVLLLEDESGIYDELPIFYIYPTKWTSVTERLPDNIDEEVLVCNEEYGKSGLGFATVAIYDGSDWLECWERKTYLTAVTHWMPLPEPPAEPPMEGE